MPLAQPSTRSQVMRCCPATVLSVLVPLLLLSCLPSTAMEAAEEEAEASSRHRDVVDRVLHLLKRNHRYIKV